MKPQMNTDGISDFCKRSTLELQGDNECSCQLLGHKSQSDLSKSDVERFVNWYQTTNLESPIQWNKLVKIAIAWHWLADFTQMEG